MTRASYILFVLMILGLAVSIYLYNKSKQRSTGFNARVNSVKEVLFLLERTEKLKNILRKTVYEGANQKDTASAFVFSADDKLLVDSILNRIHSIVLYEDQRLRIDTIKQIIDSNFRLLLHDSTNPAYYRGVSEVVTRAQSYAEMRLKEQQAAFENQDAKLDLWTNSIAVISLLLFVVGIWSIAYENTAKRRLKILHDSIKESEKRFRLLATSIPQVIWVADQQGQIEYLSDQWEKYTGQKPYEGRKLFSSLIHQDDIDLVRAKWRTAMAESKPWQAEYRLKDLRTNHYTWFSGYTLPLTDQNGKVIKWIGSSSDITLQKQSNEKLSSLVDERTRELNNLNEILQSKNIELSNAQNFLKTVLDSSVELVTAFDTDLNYTFVNKRSIDFANKNPEELIGRNIKDVHPGFEKSDGYQYLLRGLKGEVIHIDERRPFVNEKIVFETFIIPLKSNSDIIGVLTLQRDITTIIQLSENLKKSNLDLQRSNEDLQQFAHVISHDLKEPVRKINIYSNLLKSSYEAGLSDPGKIYLGKIEHATKRIAAMIDGVLQHSSVDAFEQDFERLDSQKIFSNILEDLEVVVNEKNAQIIIGALPMIEGSPTLIYQLFYNLVNNSLKFIRTNVKPVIEIRSEIVLGRELSNDMNQVDPNQEFAKIVIIDNGIGFEQTYAEKIFESFLRLNSKDKYEGTGLGLALCKKIVERHHGFIRAYGRPNEGATFEVYLPST